MPALVAAMQEGNTEATLLLGVAHEQGRSGQPNYKAAVACYKHVLEHGEPAEKAEAGCRLLNLYALDHAKPESPDWVALLFPPHGPGVNQAQAQCQLGDLYYRGKALPEDWREAVGWFTRAAQNGSAEAMNRIGELWAAGVDGEPDPNEAARWYRKAASRGFAVAQFNLGRAYAQGKGVTDDPVEACKWLHLAAAQNLRAAAEERDLLQSRMTPKQVDEARTRAARFSHSQTDSVAFPAKNLKTNGNAQGP
jgi:TPR repeat protein